MTDQKHKIIHNGIVLTPHQEIKDGVVIFQGSKIVEVGQRGQIQEPVNAVAIDAEGHYIVPGFIDIHVHGGRGANVLDSSPVALETMSSFLATRGVTAFVAAMSTAPVDQLLAGLERIRSAKCNGGLSGAEVLGAHQEGPFLNAAHKGAHPENLLLPLTPPHYEPFLEYADVLTIMTLAPELSGAVGLIQALCDANIIAAAGHTDAIYSEFVPAIDAGLSHAVHCFCNMGTLRRAGAGHDQPLKRVAGAVETILYDDRVTTELIGDGWHIGDTLMKLALKVKGPERVCWVSDAMSATGMSPGQYRVGDVEVIVEEKGIARLADNSAYAGSVTTLDVCVRNGVQRIGLSLIDAVRMATLTPAAVVGADNRKGSLEAGKDADIVVIDSNASVRLAISRGCVVYQAKGNDRPPT